MGPEPPLGGMGGWEPFPRPLEPWGPLGDFTGFIFTDPLPILSALGDAGWICVHSRTYTHKYTYTRAHTFTTTHTQHSRTHTHTYTYTRAHTFTHTHTHTHTQSHTHTHTHTNTS